MHTFLPLFFFFLNTILEYLEFEIVYCEKINRFIFVNASKILFFRIIKCINISIVNKNIKKHGAIFFFASI